jgi:hypothetical protein
MGTPAKKRKKKDALAKLPPPAAEVEVVQGVPCDESQDIVSPANPPIVALAYIGKMTDTQRADHALAIAAGVQRPFKAGLRIIQAHYYFLRDLRTSYNRQGARTDTDKAKPIIPGVYSWQDYVQQHLGYSLSWVNEVLKEKQIPVEFIVSKLIGDGKKKAAKKTKEAEKTPPPEEEADDTLPPAPLTFLEVWEKQLAMKLLPQRHCAITKLMNAISTDDYLCALYGLLKRNEKEVAAEKNESPAAVTLADIPKPRQPSRADEVRQLEEEAKKQREQLQSIESLKASLASARQAERKLTRQYNTVRKSGLATQEDLDKMESNILKVTNEVASILAEVQSRTRAYNKPQVKPEIVAAFKEAVTSLDGDKLDITQPSSVLAHNIILEASANADKAAAQDAAA